MIAADLKIEYWPIERLVPYARNPRKNDVNVDRMAGAIKEFGFRIPVVAKSDGTVVDGHLRIKAAQKLGMTKLPVVLADELTDAQIKAFRLLANRSVEWSEWDNELLAQEFAELQECDFDTELTGFDQDDIDDILCPEGTEGLTDPDDVPEVPEEPVTKPGDLYALGNHRLLCGDSTVATDVDRLMDGKKAQLCFTDPPYGADIQYATHDDTQDALRELIEGFIPLAEIYCDIIALTPGINNIWHYKKPDWMLCWFYGAGTGRSPWGFTAWQPIMVWGACPKLSNGEGCHPDGFQFMMSREDAEIRKGLNHACPKPLSVWRRFLERLTNKKSKIIYDPFLGAGTTLMASGQLNLSCYGMEIDPRYCDVIVRRWEDFTGKKATLAN